jgi:hypothetical protein
MNAPSNIRPALRASEKIFSFADGDETTRVLVTEHYRNEFTALDAENYDYDSPVGYGDTQMSAIADLFSKMPKAASEREERDVQADRFDRARDYRKHA